MVRQKDFSKPTIENQDFELIRQVAQGSNIALELLYKKHGPALLTFLISRLDDSQLAEEVLQDVMMAVWKGAHQFRGDSKVSTWLLAICRNKAINAHQRRHKHPTLSLDEVPLGELKKKEQTSQYNHHHDDLWDAIQNLPDKQKEVLELIFFHNLSGQEAARILGVPPGTIKSRLHRAKRNLSMILRSKEKEDA